MKGGCKIQVSLVWHDTLPLLWVSLKLTDHRVSEIPLDWRGDDITSSFISEI
jgi:hypothetical protein